jgi:hypothetical protein
MVHKETMSQHNIIATARETLRARHKQQLVDRRAKLQADAEAAWLTAEAKRRSDYIRKFIEDSTPEEGPTNPFEYISDEEAVRLSLDVEDRIPRLIQAGYLGEATRCIVHRFGGRMALATLQQELARMGVPTTGTATIEESTTDPHFATRSNALARQWDSIGNHNHAVVTATGVSPELRDAIHDGGLRVRNGEVIFPRWKDYPAEEF